ncbi:MAG TPA: ROK family transcriptional regulator [Symbiobacteriaceae bacterium]|nr:ROK family transcriptional regulator [Symbiobacteriaceae bacterium]
MLKRPTPGNAKLLKELNQFLVLEALRQHGSLARTDLARITGLTAPTIGLIVKGLLDEGYLLERETQPGTMVGRRAVPLELNPRAGIAIGINLGITHARVLAVDLLGGVQDRQVLTVPPNSTPEELVAQLTVTVREMVAQLKPRRLLGVGCGLHGLVDHESGTMRFAPHFGWRNVPFAELLSRSLGVAVIADNDVRCMTLGELWFGAGKGVRDFVCVAVGTGIGSGIVLDGRLHRGAFGSAGEIGHFTVDVAGPLCSCGSYGCVEALASGPAIARRAVKLVKQGSPSVLTTMVSDLDDVTAELVARAAAAGDAVGKQVMHEAGTYLGIVVANLVKLLNPQRVLIGGGVARAGDLLLEPLRQSLASRALDPVMAALPVCPIALDADAGAMGGAAQVLERFFKGESLPAYLEIIGR